MPRWLVSGSLVAAAALVAHGLVYRWEPLLSGPPLRGHVWLSGLLGGVGLAFSRPFLLVLVGFLTVLFHALRGSPAPGRCRCCGALGGYLGAFALAFVATISGTPAALAAAIYQSEWTIHRVSGVILLVWWPAWHLGRLPVRSRASVWARVLEMGCASILGAAIGALLYHELDPVYDSVFFATSNAVAASHAPITTTLFAAGLGLTYLGVGGTVLAPMVAGTSWGRGLVLGGRTLTGLATALVGLAVLSDRFGTVRALLF